jgi:membrane fusion protein (multidrug efflux system)
VVKDDNRIAVQAVRTGSVQDGQWLVLDGLKSGDRVVVDGFQKFVAGDGVNPRSLGEEAALPAPSRAGGMIQTSR